MKRQPQENKLQKNEEEVTFDGVYSKGRKFRLELLDLLQGVAFPLMIMTIFSATIIAFASSEDLSVIIIALGGGEILLGAALVMFGRANGSEAYRKTVEYSRKRSLGSADEKCVYRTGEYAVWKGAVTGLLTCVPFVIILTIELIADNSFCMFCLQYIFAWAYYPFSFCGKAYIALDYIAVLFPVAAMTFGYYLGKLKQIKIQEQLAATNPDDKRSRVYDVPPEPNGKKGKNSNGKKGKKK